MGELLRFVNVKMAPEGPSWVHEVDAQGGCRDCPPIPVSCAWLQARALVDALAPSAQQGLGKLAGVEGFEVFQFFAHADEIDRNRALLCNRGQHAAFGRTV